MCCHGVLCVFSPIHRFFQPCVRPLTSCCGDPVWSRHRASLSPFPNPFISHPLSPASAYFFTLSLLFITANCRVVSLWSWVHSFTRLQACFRPQSFLAILYLLCPKTKVFLQLKSLAQILPITCSFFPWHPKYPSLSSGCHHLSFYNRAERSELLSEKSVTNMSYVLLYLPYFHFYSHFQLRFFFQNFATTNIFK